MNKLLSIAPQIVIALSLLGITAKLSPISRNAEIIYQCSLIRAMPNTDTYIPALKRLASLTDLVTWDAQSRMASWEATSLCKETKTLNKR